MSCDWQHNLSLLCVSFPSSFPLHSSPLSQANVFAHLMRLVSGQRALKGVTPPLPGHHRPTSLPT